MSTTFRSAIRADAALLFAWQQHPDTRRYARDPRAPEWGEHLAWLDRTLMDENRELLIAEANGDPFGMVRLDYRGEPPEAEVSIVVAPGLHGRAIGTGILALLTCKATTPLLAFIVEGNAASKRIFTNVGFKDTGNGWYRYDC